MQSGDEENMESNKAVVIDYHDNFLKEKTNDAEVHKDIGPIGSS